MDAPTWGRIAALFERALELPAEDREAFVRAGSAGDRNLSDAVLRMLRHDAAEQLLDQSVDAIAAALLGSDPGEEPTLAAGEQVGHYEVLGVLGRGGMGVVYRARDTRLDRLAALKFLPTAALDEGATARIEAEARAASALDHPNIATIYHVGTGAEGRPYLAMAYYEGHTLADRLKGGALAPAEAVRIATAVAAGLAAAHQRGIVHRDVKPANIFLTADGGVKLLDFGIAAGVGADHGAPHGTPLYMSPEQARATAPHPRSDVWSLGVVLYEMLAGRPPFEADSARALRSRKAQAPAPLPARAGASPQLRRLVDRALSPDPAQRYPDAGALGSALAQVTAARRPGSWIRWALAGAAGLGVIGLGLRWASRAASPPAASPTVIAVFPFVVRGDSAYRYLGEGMVDLLSAEFDGVGGLRSVDPRGILTAESGDTPVQEPRRAAAIASRLESGRFILGEIRAGEGRLRASAGLYDRRGRLESSALAEVAGEERIFEAVDRLARELLARHVAGSGSNIKLLAAATTASLPALKSFLDGERALRNGGFEAASAAFEHAVVIDTGFTLAYYGLARSEWWAERTERARVPALRALRGAAGLPRATRMLLDGLVARLDGDLDRAEGLYRQLIALAPDEPDAWYGLGDVLFHYNALRGRSPLEAAPYFEHALSLQPDNMSVRLHLANISARQRNYARHDSLLAGLQSSTNFARFVRLVRAFAGHDRDAQDRVTLEFAGASSRRIGEALHYIVRLAHNPRDGLRFVEQLEQPGRSASDRATGRAYRAGLALALGHWNAALTDLLGADSLGDSSALPTLAIWSLAPFVPADTARWRMLQLRFERGPGETREIRQYLRGLLSARLGDTASARTLANQLDAPRPDSMVAVHHDFALAIRAELAQRRGKPAEALGWLEQMRPVASLDLLLPPVLGQAYERFARAELLRQAGRKDEALAWYQGLIEGSTLEAIYVGPAYHRSAQLLGEAGDSAAAAAAVHWFRELWADADPAVTSWAGSPTRSGPPLLRRQDIKSP